MSASESDAQSQTAPLALGCSTICFKSQPLQQALESVRSSGFFSADLGALQGLCEHIPPRGTAEELSIAADIVRRSGIEPVSLNADPGAFNRDPLDDIVSRVARLAAFCREAGVPAIVLPCGGPERDDISIDSQIHAVAVGLAASADAAEGFGIRIFIEAPHHFRLVNTLERTRTLLAQLDDRIGLVYDVSHIRAAGEDPAARFAEFAPHVEHVHLRDAVDGDIRRAMGAGDIDFAAVFAATVAAGYTGTYALELETHNSPFDSKEAEVADALGRVGTLVPELVR